MQVVYSLTIRGCAAGAMRLGGVGIPIDGRFVGGTEVYVRGGGPLPSSRRIVSDVIPLVRRLRRAMIGTLAGAAPIDLRGPLPGLV
ncbi:MAG: hypothetical protein IPL61_05440 [Myxococcales bacterium]|nr:hypothetical protein [Myxococcales bacterium]